MTRRGPRIGALAAFLATLSCTDLFGPDLPEGTVPLYPLPAEYAGWWSLVERCSGHRGDLGSVEWLVLPDTRVIPDTGGATGVYYQLEHAIVLGDLNARDGWLVRHEMLHALLRGGGHRRVDFIDNCGGIVSCGTVCTDEAGSPLMPSAEMPPMDPSNAQIEVELVPAAVRLSSGTEGCVTLVVSVRNLEDRPVRKYIGGSQSQGFFWIVDGVGGGGDTRGRRVNEIAFEAGGTRRHTFDCPQLIRNDLGPGDYAVRGEFHGVVSDATVLTVVP